MKQLTLLLVCAVFLIASVSCAASNPGLSSTFSQPDMEAVKKLLQDQKDVKDISNAYFTAKALSLIDSKPTQQTELCNLAKETLKNTADLKSVDHAAGVIEALKCTGISVDKSFSDAIKTAIDNGEQFTPLYHASSAALSLKAAGVKSDIKDDDISSSISKINELIDEDGTVKESQTDREGDLYNTGLTLNLFARMIKSSSLNDDDNDHVQGLIEKIQSIIELGNDDDKQKLFFESESHSTFATTSAITQGLETIASAKKGVKVGVVHFTKIANYLLSHKQTSTSEDAYYLLSALLSIKRSPVAPLALTIEKAAILSTAKGAEGHVKVRLTDVFDGHAVPANVYLVKAYPPGKESSVLIANQALLASNSDNKNVEYSFNFLGAKPDQGFYVLEFRVVPQGADSKKFSTIDSAIRRVKVTGSVSVSDFELVVADSREGLGTKHKVEYPNKNDDQIRIDQTQFVKVQFRVRNVGAGNRPLLAQQATLRFTNTKTGHEATFVANADNNKLYTVDIKMDEVAKPYFRSSSGLYKIDVVVGDAFIQNPIAWNVFSSVNIQFAASSSSSHSSHGNLAARPEIKHKFREPEARPKLVVSNAFTLIVLSPLAILFIGLIATGANIRRFPFSGIDFIYAVGFIGAIGSLLGLLALYWLKLNLMQTLGYLSVLSLPTLFFGQRALSHLARKEKLQ